MFNREVLGLTVVLCGWHGDRIMAPAKALPGRGTGENTGENASLVIGLESATSQHSNNFKNSKTGST